MASGAKEFIIKLFLDSDTKGAEESIKAIEKLGKAAQDLTSYGKSLSLSFTAPIAAFAGFATKNFVAFEATMSRVKAISGATGEQFKKLTAQARELGATTRFSASQAAEAMSNLSLAGFSVEQTTETMPSLLKLAAAATLDMGSAAAITSNIMRGFNLEVSELGHVNDVLVKAFTSSNTDLRSLGDAMKYVAPVAKAAGQSIEDITASVGALSNAGIQGSQAGTTLRASIAALVNPSTSGAKVLRDLGVSTKDASGNMRPFIDIVRDLGDAGVQTEQIFEIFGQRAAAGVAALVEQGGDNLKKFADDLRDSVGTTARIAKEQEDNLRGAIYEIQSAWEEVQLGFKTDVIGKALGEVIMLGYDLLTAFGKSDESTKNWIASLGLALAAVGPLTMAVGKLGGVLATLSKWQTIAVSGFQNFMNAATTATIKTWATTAALVALRAAISALGIGLLITGLSAVASHFIESAASANELRKQTDEANASGKILAQTYGEDVTSALWKANREAGKAKIIDLEKQVADAEKDIGDYVSHIDFLKAKQNEISRSAHQGSSLIAANYAIEIKELEKLKAAKQEQNELAKAELAERQKIFESETARETAAAKQEENDLKALGKSWRTLQQVQKIQAQDRMNDVDKLASKEKDLATVAKQIIALNSQANDYNLSAKERKQAVEEMIAKTRERGEIEKSLIDLRKKADEENKRAAELEKKKSNAVAAKKNLDILRATVAQNWQLVDALSDELAIEREFLSLKEQGGIADDEARAIAEEKVALNRQMINEERLAKMQDKVIEAEINSLRKDGKKTEADALEIRKKAKDYANDFKVSYEDALKAIKKIDEIQNGGDKKNTKNGKLGTNYDQLEKRQQQIQKNLESKNIGTVEKGRRQQEEFENKYGIGITDDVRDYRGRDRKTGRLINAKVGKEARENEHYSAEAYAQAAKDGDIARPQSEAAALQPVSTTNASVAIAANAPILNGKLPPLPPSAFGQNSKAPAAFGQNSKAPAAAAQSQPLGLFRNREPLPATVTAATPEASEADEKAKEERRKPKSISAGQMPTANNMVSSVAGKKSKSKKPAEESKGDSGGAGEITSTVEQGVAALATIVADIKKLVDGIETLKRELNGSVSRLNRR